MVRFLSLVSLIAVVLVAGCQTTKPAAQATSGDQAVMCGKCQVTWRQIPRREKGRVVSYSTRKSIECPDCRKVAEAYFATGNLKPCPTCGDAMEVCTMK